MVPSSEVWEAERSEKPSLRSPPADDGDSIEPNDDRVDDSEDSEGERLAKSVDDETGKDANATADDSVGKILAPFSFCASGVLEKGEGNHCHPMQN